MVTTSVVARGLSGDLVQKWGPKQGGVPFFRVFGKNRLQVPQPAYPSSFGTFGYYSPSQPTPHFLAAFAYKPPGGEGSHPVGSTRGPRGMVSDKIFSKKRKIWGGGAPLGPEKMQFLVVFREVLFCRREVFGPPGTCGSLTPDKFQLLMGTLKETPPRILEIWTKVVSGEAPPRDP